ncbi:hypothetical protein G6F56_002081 [Rhizopus delemar]|nr:hypothetical protein G6F56_002081 [Rhizopus delemar]
MWKFWIVFEGLFYLYFLYTRNILQKKQKPKRPLNKQDRKLVFYHCLDTIPDLRVWCQGWFYYKNFSHPTAQEIKRDNLASWLAWAFWHDTLENIAQEDQEEINWMISTAQDKFNIYFLEGYNPDLHCIRLDLDPVQAIHRPLIFYGGLYLATQLFGLALRYWGFHHTSATIPYWSRHTTLTKTPLVFIHGVGIGLLGYMDWIRHLPEDRPLYLIELDPISMRLTTRVPCAIETVESIQKMLPRPAVFVSHSLGTGVSSWVSRFAPDLVAGSVMMDPICFLLHHSHVAFNFIHRLPRTLLEFAPLENTSVFVSEKDRIVCAENVYRYLKEHGVDVYWMAGLEHAEFLLNADWKQVIYNQISKICIQADQMEYI